MDANTNKIFYNLDFVSPDASALLLFSSLANRRSISFSPEYDFH